MGEKLWLIDANATIAEAEKRRDLHPKGSRARDSYNLIMGFIKYNSYTVDAVEVVHGRWIDAREHCGDYMCSNCDALYGTNKFKYCPNCGAKMDGGNEDV